MFKFAPRLGSGDSGVRKCETVANFNFKFAPRLGSGDSGVGKCISVANFVSNFAPRLGFERFGGHAGREGNPNETNHRQVAKQDKNIWQPWRALSSLVQPCPALSGLVQPWRVLEGLVRP